MADTTQKTIRTVKSETSVKDGGKLLQQLRRKIRMYERRYEVSSGQMEKMLNSGEARDTREVLRWMMAYHEAQLLERATPTDGIRTTTTRLSTKNP